MIPNFPFLIHSSLLATDHETHSNYDHVVANSLYDPKPYHIHFPCGSIPKYSQGPTESTVHAATAEEQKIIRLHPYEQVADVPEQNCKEY